MGWSPKRGGEQQGLRRAGGQDRDSGFKGDLSYLCPPALFFQKKQQRPRERSTNTRAFVGVGILFLFPGQLPFLVLIDFDPVFFAVEANRKALRP